MATVTVGTVGTTGYSNVWNGVMQNSGITVTMSTPTRLHLHEIHPDHTIDSAIHGSFTGAGTSLSGYTGTVSRMDDSLVNDVPTAITEGLNVPLSTFYSGVYTNSDLFSGNDVFRGGAHGDRMAGFGGSDTLYGAGGSDELYGNKESDMLYGEDGADWLYGGQGGDTLVGGSGDDVLYANMQNDLVFAGEGNDTVYGGQGDDRIYGEAGDDVLLGDLGVDTFVFGVASGADRIVNFSAAQGDRIELEGQSFTLGTAADGSAVLALSGGGTVILSGVATNSFSAAWVF